MRRSPPEKPRDCRAAAKAERQVSGRRHAVSCERCSSDESERGETRIDRATRLSSACVIMFLAELQIGICQSVYCAAELFERVANGKIRVVGPDCEVGVKRYAYCRRNLLFALTFKRRSGELICS